MSERRRIDDSKGNGGPPGEDSNDSGPISGEMGEIADWLRSVRFKKTFLGGVSEADVWKKIGELNNLYEIALKAERMRCEALLAENTGKAARRAVSEKSVQSAEKPETENFRESESPLMRSRDAPAESGHGRTSAGAAVPRSREGNG